MSTDTTQLYEGAFETSDGFRLPDIWQTIHSNAFDWEHVPKNNNFFKLRKIIDDADKEVYGKLSEVPIDRWMTFCEAAGWTGYGAAAASHCEGASRTHVWNCFKSVPYILNLDESTMRLVGLINQEIVPKIDSLRSIVLETQNNVELVALQLIIAHSSAMIDLTEAELSSANDSLRNLIVTVQDQSFNIR